MLSRRRSRRKGWRDEDDEKIGTNGWRVTSVYRILFFTALSHRAAKADTLYSPDHYYEAFAAPYQNDYGSHYSPTWNRAQPVYGSYLASPALDPAIRRPARPLDALRFVGSTLANSRPSPRVEPDDVPVAPLKAPSPVPSSLYDALVPLSPPFRLGIPPQEASFSHHRHSDPATYPAPVEPDTSTKPPLAPAVDKPFFEFIAEWEGKPGPQELPEAPSDGEKSSQVFEENSPPQPASFSPPSDATTLIIRLDDDLPSEEASGSNLNSLPPPPEELSEVESQPLEMPSAAPVPNPEEEATEEELPTPLVDTTSTSAQPPSSTLEVFKTEEKEEVVEDAVALGGLPSFADPEPRFQWPVVRAIPIASPGMEVPHERPPPVGLPPPSEMNVIYPPIRVPDLGISGDEIDESLSSSLDSLIVPESSSDISLTTPSPVRKFALPCCHHFRSKEASSMQEAAETEVGGGGYLAQLRSVAQGGYEWCDYFLGPHESSGGVREVWLPSLSVLLIFLIPWV